MRAEKDNKTALTTLYRNEDMILGLVGGRCRETGVIQFPRTRISVAPTQSRCRHPGAVQVRRTSCEHSQLLG